MWPSYRGPEQKVGTSQSGRVTVYVDPTLGAAAVQNAQDLLKDADRIVAANDALFGSQGAPVNVIIFALGGQTDGTGGADHASCDYVTGGNIEVDAAFGQPMRVSALFEAELSECSMGGNLCGVSTGEALSRWCAAIIGNNALADFATAPDWVAAGKPDWVNKTEYTDQNPVSTGCGMAFISWLLNAPGGLDLGEIARSMVRLTADGTLADLYEGRGLGPKSDAWPKFIAAVNALPNGVTSDDPFGAMPAAA